MCWHCKNQLSVVPPPKERENPFMLLGLSVKFREEEIDVISHGTVLQELRALCLNLNLVSYF